MEQEEELYTANKVKQVLRWSESTYRTTLRAYKEYLPHKKALKNKDLFPWSTVSLMAKIQTLKKDGYTKSEIVSKIKSSTEYLESKLNSSDQKELRKLNSMSDIDLVHEFTTRLSETNREIRILNKTLEKRTVNYQNEISQLKDELNTSESRLQKNIEDNQRNLTILTKTIWKLEEELKQVRNESFFDKVKQLFRLKK